MTNKTVLPSMKELTDFLNAQSAGISKKDIARRFHIKGDERIELKQMLRNLKEEGLIERDKSSRSYRLMINGRLPEYCQVEITGQDSMGDLLARPLKWQSDEALPQIMIIKDKMNPPAGMGDIVQAKLKFIGKNMYEGTALKRISRQDNQIVALYENGKIQAVDRRLTQTFLLPDVPRTLQNRDLIIAAIPPIRTREPTATFVEKIGSMDDPHFATICAVYMHRLPVMFTEKSEKEAAHLSVPPLDKNREDLRDIPFVTIDGADARDFDDAVWAEPDSDSQNPNGFHLMIAIADVCWYVRPGSALDSDAWTRGNSVYFPDKVIPMLPFELSNGVCSLNPNETRAALVCEAWIDQNGRKRRHRFRRALIRSVRRLTYDDVQTALDGIQQITGLEKEINALNQAYLALKKQRENRGVMEINIPEQEVILDHKGKVIRITARQQTAAMQLIEEFMILANVAAAETLEEKGKPVMYRVHDHPSLEKIAALNRFLTNIGIKQKHPFTEHSQTKAFNEVLKQAAKSDKAFTINEFMLRSQSQAQYADENIGHFGLALERYAHFTSPIRRYADLTVHRALISALKLGDGGLTPDEEATFKQTAKHISYTERQAASAEQDAKDRYIAGFLQSKLNKRFDGKIASVTSFGLFVRLLPFGTDGFIPLQALSDDFYEFDEEKQLLVGRGKGKTYRLGDSVKVILRQCDVLTGRLTLQPIK